MKKNPSRLIGNIKSKKTKVNFWTLEEFQKVISLLYKGDYKFVEPKTQASVRTIYIDTDTIKELQAWREVQQKALKGCDLGLSYNGIPTSKHTLPRALEKLAGVHRIKIHALRHSHASRLISMGENPLLIKERLGHEKIQTTLGTYGLLWSSFFVTLMAKKYLLVREPILPPFMLQFSFGKEYGIRYSCEDEHDYMLRRQILLLFDKVTPPF